MGAIVLESALHSFFTRRGGGNHFMAKNKMPSATDEIPELTSSLRIMGFVIPVVFYDITNIEFVYSSNTTIFIGRI
jgi:hypothetical protein